jgi:hypothetical protein
MRASQNMFSLRQIHPDNDRKLFPESLIKFKTMSLQQLTFNLNISYSTKKTFLCNF